MNNFLSYNNVLTFDSSFQKLDSSIFNDNIDIESINYRKDKTFEKTKAINRIYKENDLFRFVNLTNDIPFRFDNLPEYNIQLIPFHENNVSFFNEDIYQIPIPRNSQFSGKNKKIFEIVKINKKIGRIKKNSVLKGVHNKLSEDNIIRKIKGRFIEKIRLYINAEYQKYILNKSKTKKKICKWLKKTNPKVSLKIKKEDNLKWFNTKISEIFSENISSRYSSCGHDINKKRINIIITQNKAKNVIKILNSKVETLFDKYINNEKIEGFKTLKDDIHELEKHMKNSDHDEVNDYLKKYEYVAQNMKTIFKQKNSRNSSSK